MGQRLLVGLLAGTLGCAGGLVSVAQQRYAAGDRSPDAVVQPAVSTTTPGGTAPGSPAGTTPSTPSGTSSPLTAVGYQRVLTAMDARLRQDLRRLASGRVDTVRLQLVTALRSQAATLESVEPPPTVAAAHVRLQSALRTAAAELETLSVNSPYCGGAPATVRRIHDILTRGGTGLTYATAVLRAHHLGAGTFLPRRPDLRPRRGTNGRIYRSGKRGSGRLEIINKGSSDYAISVVTGKPSKPQIMIYVRAHSRAKVSGVRGSVYHVYVKGGADWDGTRRQFTRDCSFEKFDQPFTQLSWPFYSIWKLTLDTSDGNTTSSQVDPY